MLAWNLALHFARTRRVAVFDRDPQGAIQLYLAQRTAVTGSNEHPFDLYADLESDLRSEILAADADIGVIDTAPTIGGDFAALPTVAHRIVIPVRPGIADAASLSASLDVLLTQNYPIENVLVVPNALEPRLRVNVGVMEHLARMREEYGFRISTQGIRQRTVYGYALAYGKGVVEWQANDAIPEIIALANEIQNP